MKSIKTKVTTVAAAVSLAVAASATMAGNGNPNPGKKDDGPGYEIWGADQSNSVAGAAGRGVDGSFLWIWDSADVQTQIKGGADAQPLGCDGTNTAGDGPCDLHDVFPGALAEHDGSGLTGETLATSPLFGRLHGMLPDPQNLYQNINSFVGGGGYVGIVDGRTKEAVALWRVTQTNGALSGNGRSLHMSFWAKDGSALFLANLHGRILERIDITRDADGNITGADYNRAASLNVGAALSGIDDVATAFTGNNAHGNPLVSTVSGSYDATAALGGTTPSGADRQNPDRPVNVIVCPIVSENGNVYITMGGGGLLVADGDATPMTINGEYDRSTVNGAGCGGVEDNKGMIWLNAGASAAGSGATQSTFSMYAIDDDAIEAGAGVGVVNTPAPITVFKDAGNTATIGNDFGPASNGTGQLPGVSTRRDAHGAAITLDGRYIHNVDRIQNNVEVFSANTRQRIGTYDLTSANGQGQGTGPCEAASVTDDAGLPSNDVAPDLMDTTPDGKYLVVATRGPTPVSVTHNAQGSCPGVGIIALDDNGKTGRLAAVLRSTNTIDTAAASAPGGHAYTGNEHSDPHGASVISKGNW